MATLQGKAVKNTYRQVLQIGANNVGVSGTLQPVQDGTGTNTALSLSTAAATINGTLTITGDLIITGGGIQIQDLIDDTVASLIQNGTGITWAYNDTLRTLTPTITIATADGGVQGDFLQLNVNANETSAVGKLKWNTTDGTMDIGLMGGNVVLQVGQEQVARVLNNSGTILTEAGYQAVKIASAQGQRLAVNLAQANTEANSTDTLGLVTENIANNQEGFVTTSGLVREIDTTGDLQTEVWVDGDTLYLSPTIPGGVTKVKPLAPQQTVIVGFVVYAHKIHGKIFVKVDNGYELNELHNVRITSVANNNVLKYNSSLAVWENVAPITTWITEGTNLYYTQARFDSAFAAKTTTNLAEGANLYFTTARGDANFATNFATKTTTNLPEGTNLYWTTARGNSNFTTNLAASSTTNLAEGTNLYYTQARFDTAFSNKTTTNLAEGTNLYYTTARFNAALATKTTTDLAEGTNLYYTDARARLALASSATGLTYANNSGIFSLTAGYAIPTTVKLGEYDIAYNRSLTSAAVTGTSTKTLTLNQQSGSTITASWTDQGITTINGTANQIAANTVGNTTTIGFTNDVTMPNNLIVSGNLTINGTATYVNTQSISAKDPLFEVANDNNTTDAVDIGYYGRYYDTPQTRIEFTGLFRDASDAGKFKFFTGLVDEPTNVVNTSGVGYTIGTLVANFEGNLAGTANAANTLSTARTIAASGDATWSVSFDGSANVSSALTLANTGVTATTYGTTTAVPTIAIDSKGRITSASNTNIAFPVTTVNSQSGTVVLTTSNVAEGTNQYFTSARAQASITGGASSVVTSNLTAASALVSDGTGKIAASASTTATEVSYLAGVTSAIQTQLNTKALDSNTVHISGTETITGAKTFSGGLSSNALTLTGTLGGTSATFSGTITYSGTSNALTATSGTTGYLYQSFVNTGGSFYFGLERSIGGGLLTNSSAYATILTTNNATNVEIGTNGVKRITVDGTNGITTFNSNIYTLGQLHVPNNSTGTLGGIYFDYNANIASRTWQIVTDYDAYGDFQIRQSTTQTGSVYSKILGFSPTGAATFTSSISAIAGNFGGDITIAKVTPGIILNGTPFGNSGAYINLQGWAASNKNWQIGVANVGGGGLNFTPSTAAGGTSFTTPIFNISDNGSINATGNSSTSYTATLGSTHSTTPYVIRSYSSTDTNNSTGQFLMCDAGASVQRMSVRMNGGIYNYSANNSNLSDARLKKDIIPLESYWDKFKAIEMVKFKYKDQTHDDYNIGVIAQQVESVAPEFIDTDWDSENIPEDGIPIKSVYESDLHHATIKVLQEAMTKIETLETKIAILEAK